MKGLRRVYRGNTYDKYLFCRKDRYGKENFRRYTLWRASFFLKKHFEIKKTAL